MACLISLMIDFSGVIGSLINYIVLSAKDKARYERLIMLLRWKMRKPKLQIVKTRTKKQFVKSSYIICHNYKFKLGHLKQ